MELSEGLKDALVILSHFPASSLALNTYSVYRVLMSATKGDISVLKTQAAVETVLPMVLHEYSRILNVSPSALTKHYGLFYGANSGKMSKFAQKVLKSEVLAYLLSVRVSKLLSSNSELLTWEFLRNCARRYPKDPFTESAISPIPDAYAGSTVVLSKEAALAFALENGIGDEIAMKELSNVLALTGLEKPIALTYSGFLIYAIRCYVSANVIVGAGDGESKQTRRGVLNEKVVESCVKKMLHHFSERLTRLQQSIRIRILAPLLQIDRNARKDSILASEDRYESLLRKTLTFYATKSINRDLAAAFSFPPRPPDVLVDAPRAVGFFADCGVVETAGSLVQLWRAFGANSDLKTDRDTLMVSPTPMQLTENKEVLCGILKGVTCIELGTIDGYELDWEESILHTVFPVLVARGDFSLDSKERGIGSKSKTQLEDILRYGGSSCMQALNELGGWLRRVYEILTDAGENEELLMNPACRFASCHGLVRMGVVAVQAREALHARIRPPPVTPGSVTMSYPEFEELFLRCAFTLWAQEGESTASGQQQISHVFAQVGQPVSMHITAGTLYRQRCVTSTNGQEPLQNHDDTALKWGTDFVTPFGNALVEAGVHLLENDGASELCAFFGLDRDIVEKIFEEIPMPATTEGSKQLFQTAAPLQLQSPKSAVPKLSNSPPRSPTRTSEAMDLLNQKDVQSRSGELLEGILKSRSSAPLTPQKRQILKTIIEGNGSPEGKSLGSSPANGKDRFPSAEGSIAHRESATGDRDNMTPPDSPNATQAKAQRQALIPSPTRLLLDGTKEALWPVYGTYCSCGDSIDPGKLSGPNLFALLSKLGVLTDATIMSDIGILLHQISAHTHSSSVSIAATSSSEAFESPSLSFEEFLVFLCAFAQLRFDGIISAPILNSGEISQELSSAGSQNTDIWLQNWKTFMGSSSAFRRLMEESVLPMLKKYPLLAFPEDARHRDRYSAVFSLEVLLAVESSETLLREVFDDGQERDGVSVTAILEALKHVELVPNVVNEEEVIQLIRDVIPEGQKQSMSRGIGSPRGMHMRKQKMIFPQWEWVICIVSFQAVEKDLLQSGEDPTINIRNIPSLVADVITFIATAATR